MSVRLVSTVFLSCEISLPQYENRPLLEQMVVLYSDFVYEDDSVDC